jgi:FecR protein
MSNEQSAREEQAVFEPLAELARDTLGHMTHEQSVRGEAVLAARLAARSQQQRHVRLALVWAAAAAAAAVLVAVGAHWKRMEPGRPAPLSFRIETASSASAVPFPSASAARLLRFSDGTEIRVEPGAQAQVRSVSDHGATVAMSRGTLHADVVHSSSSEWRFDAGPFTVHVTGTAFQLAWEPAQDRFDLRLERGAVTVTSPVANDAIPLRSGQWLTIRPHSNQVFIRDLQAPVEPELALSAQAMEGEASPTSAPDSGAEPRGAEPRTVVAPKPRHQWARDLARGKAEQIVAEAQGLGLESCLDEASGPELAALADAARYTRRDEIARKAMLAERRRFAGSRRGVDAGLLLGRLAEAEHDDRQALRWFNTYLAEAPVGLYASEALGRKMAILRRVIGEIAARPVAQDYLTRYPDGTYAAAARAILNSP